MTTFLPGERLVVEASNAPIGRVQAGSEAIVRYRLSNRSGRQIKLVGATTSCSCTMVENLPMILAASMTKELTAKVDVPEGKADITGSIQIYTDEPSIPVINLTYTIRIAQTATSH